jgi:hypothetical protein
MTLSHQQFALLGGGDPVNQHPCGFHIYLFQKDVRGVRKMLSMAQADDTPAWTLRSLGGAALESLP